MSCFGFFLGTTLLDIRYMGSVSMPMGFYHMRWKPVQASDPQGYQAFLRALHPGVLVGFRPPKVADALAVSRGYSYEYEVIVKPIRAVAGDSITADTSGITIYHFSRFGVGPTPNNRLVPPTVSPQSNSRILAKDSRGRSMPVHRYPYRIGPDSVLVLSAYHPRSFDGRYYGPISMDDVQGIATALWVRR